jgi:hypothetical protein
VFAGDFPPDIGKIIFPSGVDEKPMVIFVVPQE